ncbi:hypothetical protein GBAR_LOCUS4474 [Geodia barretti]|uniref:Uncharacterized protein n=1 Tax=Geodia barretti TaxID=519541 RepID=A0AA35R6T7_GEOBA|nr:hypothetical protein GBAR_LOCUS4474 [Geodia barretti]
MEKQKGNLLVALVLTLLYYCQECVLGVNSTDNSTLSLCNYTSCDSSSFSKELRTALAVSGGSAVVGVGGVLVLLAVILVCKRRCKRRKSYTPEAGQGAPARRATTFSKRSMKGSQSGTPPDLTHNYETVLPNFKKPPAKAAALAQNYEIPLPKAATLPRDLSTCAGKDPITPIMKFSQSVKVRGSTPEAVYMNVKETPTGEDVCAMKPVEPPQTVGQGASLTHREAMGLCLIIRWLKLKWDQFPRVIPGQITNGSIYVATLKYPFSFGSIRAL